MSGSHDIRRTLAPAGGVSKASGQARNVTNSCAAREALRRQQARVPNVLRNSHFNHAARYAAPVLDDASDEDKDDEDEDIEDEDEDEDEEQSDSDSGANRPPWEQGEDVWEHPEGGRYFIVPIHEKEEAQSMGARFDWDHKMWYAGDEGADEMMAERWKAAGRQVHDAFFHVPNHRVHQARCLGAVWDDDHLTWRANDSTSRRQLRRHFRQTRA